MDGARDADVCDLAWEEKGLLMLQTESADVAVWDLEGAAKDKGKPTS